MRFVRFYRQIFERPRLVSKEQNVFPRTVFIFLGSEDNGNGGDFLAKFSTRFRALEEFE